MDLKAKHYHKRIKLGVELVSNFNFGQKRSTLAEFDPEIVKNVAFVEPTKNGHILSKLKIYNSNEFKQIRTS